VRRECDESATGVHRRAGRQHSLHIHARPASVERPCVAHACAARPCVCVRAWRVRAWATERGASERGASERRASEHPPSSLIMSCSSASAATQGSMRSVYVADVA